MKPSEITGQLHSLPDVQNQSDERAIGLIEDVACMIHGACRVQDVEFMEEFVAKAKPSFDEVGMSNCHTWLLDTIKNHMLPHYIEKEEES